MHPRERMPRSSALQLDKQIHCIHSSWPATCSAPLWYHPEWEAPLLAIFVNCLQAVALASKRLTSSRPAESPTAP